MAASLTQAGGTNPGTQPGSSDSPHSGHGSSTITPGDFSAKTTPEPGRTIGRTLPSSARYCVTCRQPWHTVLGGVAALSIIGPAYRRAIAELILWSGAGLTCSHLAAYRWITEYDRRRVHALADLKHALEDPMARPEFVYTSYINTTPERLWQALTTPEFTKRYWGVTFETDWREGSTMVWHDPDGRIEDPEQVVIESDPYRRLSYRWHTFTPEWAAGNGISEEARAELAAERRSKVTFLLEPYGEAVKLTVVHDDGGSALIEAVSTGWPEILSNLKSLLETDKVLAKP